MVHHHALSAGPCVSSLAAVECCGGVDRGMGQAQSLPPTGLVAVPGGLGTHVSGGPRKGAETQRTYSRKIKKKRVADILHLSPRSQQLQINSTVVPEVVQVGQSTEDSGGRDMASLTDSLIDRHNRILADKLNQQQECPGEVSPASIWDFLKAVGVQGAATDCEMVQRISDLEARDAA
ncbi:hypothetical protein Ancab_019388, partial [Ancistrocladus abbreviatus]